MSTVALIKCNGYDESLVKRAVQRGIDLLGGAKKFSRKGEKILLKPNLLVAEVPQKCVTTHPAVFKAVAEVFQSTGARISVGDSPAMGNGHRAAKKSGILEIAERIGVPLADFKTGVEVFYKDGKQNRKFIIAKAVTEADGVISLPKLKPHAFERLTGAVKNQFGCIPGVLKGEYHVKLPDAFDFAKMLVDLDRYVNPRLYIMDGILAMEGNGPRGGTPKKMNVLLFSTDPVALDATACRLIDLQPAYVPTITIGELFGAGTYRKDGIKLVGDSFDELKDSSFKITRAPIRSYKTAGIQRFFNNRLVPKPYIIEKKCNLCGTCVSMCPAETKAVNWLNGNEKEVPRYDYDECLRCYCCQEVCPESAIKLKVPLTRRLIPGMK